MSGVIDEFFVALGFKIDPRGLQQVRQSVSSARESILSLGNAVRFGLAGAGIGAMVAGAARIGNQWEQNKIQIAGFLNALGVSGSFNEGMDEASRVMDKITKDAALLPGEAEEYIDVFKTAFPVIKEAMRGATVDQMVDFSNKMAAYGKSQSLDSGTTARETNMLLGAHGRAGGHIVLWQRIQSLLPKLASGATLDAQAFNEMTQTKRFELLQGALVKLDPMLKASAKSFDAMWGAVKSAFNKIIRLATEGLFGQLKTGLDKLNSAFFDSNNELTDFGKRVVAGFKEVVSWGLQLVDAGIGIVSWLADLSAGAKKAALAGLLMLGVWLFPMLALGAAIVLVVEDFYRFKTGGESVIGLLVNKFGPALELIKALLVGVGIAMVAWGGATAVQYALMLPRLIRIGLAILLMNGAMILILVTIAAVGAAAYELWDNWQVITTWMKDAWHDFWNGIKEDIASFNPFQAIKDLADPFHLFHDEKQRSKSSRIPQAAGAAGPGPAKWQNPATGLMETHPAGWVPPSASMSGEEYASSMGSASSTHDDAVSLARAMMDREDAARIANSNFSTSNGPVTINITAPDAEAAGKAVEKVMTKGHRSATRNAQTAKVL